MKDLITSNFVAVGSVLSVFVGILLGIASHADVEDKPHTPVHAVQVVLKTDSDGEIPVAGPMANSSNVEPAIDSVELRYAGDLFDDENLPTTEVPDFQQHVVPLLGRLGCNGRACHGSFQGQGGFQLSLFGFDFEADHTALLDSRVEVDDAEFSLMLTKAIDGDGHGGGMRFEEGSWQYNLLYRWIEGGAPAEEDEKRLERLVVSPAEILATDNTEPIELEVIAEWEDGRREDITTLCRFQSNDPSVADVTEDGVITSENPGDTHIIVLYDNAVQPVAVVHPVANAVINEVLPEDTEIDRLVVEKLNKLGIERSGLADDVTFLRRVSLDIAGTLPSPAEIEAFISDRNPDKRDRKIEELLETPAYAAMWTTFFCDLTGNNSREFNNSISRQKISQFWYDWIYERVESNMPYNEMVEGIVLSRSREPGETYTEFCENLCEHYRTPDNGPGSTEYERRSTLPYYWMRQNFRDGETRAISFAHSFMGIRIQCAQCHKHPFDQWTQNDFKQFSRFFTGVTPGNVNNIGNLRRNAERDETAREALAIIEQTGIDVDNLRGNQLRREFGKVLKEGMTIPFIELRVHPPELSREERARNRRDKKRQRFYTDAILLGGEGAEDLTEFEDVRSPVMRWLNQRDNPYFAPAIVNRVWAHYFGVGIVDPADDLNLANPPSNAPLMEYLVEGFIDNGYDMKWLHREIATSRTYQLSWEPTETNVNDRRNFSHALPRRLPAEVAYDAVRQAVAGDELNGTFSEELTSRTIAIAGTEIPQRRRETNPLYALQIFGKSSRANSCDCDRSNETSLSQTVWLQNDRDIHALLTSDESWARELTANSLGVAERERIEEELAKIQRHLGQLVEREMELFRQEGKERQLERLRRQVAKLEEQEEEMRARLNEAADQTDFAPETLISRAYLRTLSRYPTEAELERCRTFFTESNSIADNVTGLLWALLNTKEFIVNH
ncbi:MAG: DUF1549 domain-containing protein [Planctomycetota bacterium]